MIEVRKSVFDGEASGMSVISATNTARGRAFFVRLFVVNSLTLTLSPMQPFSDNFPITRTKLMLISNTLVSFFILNTVYEIIN